MSNKGYKQVYFHYYAPDGEFHGPTSTFVPPSELTNLRPAAKRKLAKMGWPRQMTSVDVFIDSYHIETLKL